MGGPQSLFSGLSFLAAAPAPASPPAAAPAPAPAAAPAPVPTLAPATPYVPVTAMAPPQLAAITRGFAAAQYLKPTLR